MNLLVKRKMIKVIFIVLFATVVVIQGAPNKNKGLDPFNVLRQLEGLNAGYKEDDSQFEVCDIFCLFYLRTFNLNVFH